MKKLITMSAIAAIAFGSVNANARTSSVKPSMQNDTTKKKLETSKTDTTKTDTTKKF